MDQRQTKTLSKVVGGCGCALLVVIALWFAFLVSVGVQGRGKDEEMSIILGLVTCTGALPIVILTAVGLYVGLRKDEPPS